MAKEKIMKVKDLIATLSTFNPESEIQEVSRIYQDDAPALGEISLGKAYIARDGRRVKIISDEAEGHFRFVGLIDNADVGRYQEDGEAFNHRDDDIISDINYQEIKIAGYKVRVMDVPEACASENESEW